MKDGGSAFPTVLSSTNDGMSLRDYFAAAALTSLLNEPGAIGEGTPAIAAALSYKFADAMLKARAPQQSGSEG